MSMFEQGSFKSCVPDRVYVRDSAGCLGVTAKVAEVVFKVKPSIVFFRCDGWTLGSDLKDIETTREAYELWERDWEGYLLLDESGECPDQAFHDISEFRRM